jgi:hypothetical protein
MDGTQFLRGAKNFRLRLKLLFHYSGGHVNIGLLEAFGRKDSKH